MEEILTSCITYGDYEYDYLMRRWPPVLPFATRLGRLSLGLDSCQHSLRSSLVMVLVHYTSGIPLLAIFEQYRSFHVPHCWHLLDLYSQYGGLSLWNGMECGKNYGSYLF